MDDTSPRGLAPCLWFAGRTQQAARFYVSVFPNSAISVMSHCGKDMPLSARTVPLVLNVAEL